MTERVYLFRNIVNSVIVLGDEAVAVIDTQVNAPMAERLVQQVRTLSDKPLRYAINTHYHWDHTAGNHVCKRAGATVVSSALTRTFMTTRSTRQQAFLASRGFELGPAPYLADATVTEPHTLDLGNQRLCLMHLGKAESDDALVIHLPQEGCVVAGDTVMTGSFPMFGQPVMNEGLMGTSAWLETLQAIERLQPVHVLPGHGPVAHEQEFMLLKRLERYFLEEVAVRVARGMPPASAPRRSGKAAPGVDHGYSSGVGDTALCHSAGVSGIWWTTRLTNRDGSTTNLRPYLASDQARVQAACVTLADLRAFQEVAKEYEEGGDLGSAIAVARSATDWAPTEPAVWVFLAECLMRSAASVVSVLEKGDFFSEARQALQRALELEPMVYSSPSGARTLSRDDRLS